MGKLGFKLRPELEGKYQVINTILPILHSRIGVLDFRTMTQAQAEQLILAGTRYLKKIKQKTKKQVL